MKPIIEFQRVTFKYKAQQEPTLQDIDLTIYQGEKVLFLGPSGSGKSTLGQCLNGLIPHIHAGDLTGNLLVRGQEIVPLSIEERSLLVSTVLQDTDGQFIGLTVAEDLAFALENDVVAPDEMRNRVEEWSRRLELTNLLQHRPQDLSGGQKQRVSLAGVLIDESPILLFDEPLANLDPKSGQDAIELIDRLHREEGATTLIIEHRLEDVLHRPVDRVVLLAEGRIVFNGSPDELLASDLLKQHGIRQPLYLSTLQDLGYDKQASSSLAALADMDLSSVAIPELPQEWASSPVQTPLLEFKNLSVTYGQEKVLKGMTQTIYESERLAIVGKNGAGKSTLAKALCGFVPVEGELLWKGESMLGDSVKERSEKIGYVLQNPNQMISQTMIFDEVALGLRLRGVSEEEVNQRVDKVLETCGLAAFRNWPIAALSYGQKKRVTIASILVLEPAILLLDEPTAGQDEKHYTDIMEFLNELNRAGQTIVMVTHDMQLMLDYSDRALVVVDGQIIGDAQPSEILSDAAIMAAANLKETSIFALAERLGVSALGLTRFYMEKGGLR